MYLTAVRALLGVRSTAPSKLCMIEAGIKPLVGMVKMRQKKFFERMITSRSDLTDDPLMHSLTITKEMNKVMWTYIDSLMKGGNFVVDEVESMKNFIRNASPSATKFGTYLALNPELTTHDLYTKQAPIVLDYLRITFTRYRLSSHRLRIEIGRWSRTPREQRTCPCEGGIQDESHIFMCPLVRDLFNACPKMYANPADLFLDTTSADLHVLHSVLNRLYKKETVHATSD